MSMFESNRKELHRFAETAGFGSEIDMTEAERLLLKSIAMGEWEDCSGWDEKEKTIRSKLFEWLLIHTDLRPLLHPKGVRIVGATFEQAVDLQDARIDFPLWMNGCTFKKDIILRYARIRTLSLIRSKVKSIYADGIEVKGSVYLRGEFEAESEVCLIGAVIGGSLDCTNGKFKIQVDEKNPKALALSADGIEVKNGVFLRNGFEADGEVRLAGAVICGPLDCTGGKFKNPEAMALYADEIEVKGGVLLKKVYAEGEVRLLGAVIVGSLECDGSKFIHRGIAFHAVRIKVKGSVFLRNGFEAQGEVRLLNAVIDGQLDCVGGKFKNPADKKNSEANALCADGIEVKGSVFMRDGFISTGRVVLIASQIKGWLDFQDAEFRSGREDGQDEAEVLFLNSAVVEGSLCFVNTTTHKRPAKISGRVMLRHAHVGQLIDSPEVWEPKEGDPVPAALDGFSYNSLGLAEGTIEVEFRKRWLERGEVFGGPFAPQPYTQLAKVLREAGHEERAKKILIARGWQRLERMRGELGFWDPIISRLHGRLLGFGYRIRVPLFCLLFLAVYGALLFDQGWKGEQFNPAVPFIYNSYREEIRLDDTVVSVQRHTPPYQSLSTDSDRLPQYPAFAPLIYSLDTLLPIVDLHQENYWMPTGYIRVYLWIHIGAGWVFTTMAVVGFTGLVRKE